MNETQLSRADLLRELKRGFNLETEGRIAEVGSDL